MPVAVSRDADGDGIANVRDVDIDGDRTRNLRDRNVDPTAEGQQAAGGDEECERPSRGDAPPATGTTSAP